MFCPHICATPMNPTLCFPIEYGFFILHLDCSMGQSAIFNIITHKHSGLCSILISSPSNVVYMGFIRLHILIKYRKVFSCFVIEYRSGYIHMHSILLFVSCGFHLVLSYYIAPSEQMTSGGSMMRSLSSKSLSS